MSYPTDNSPNRPDTVNPQSVLPSQQPTDLSGPTPNVDAAAPVTALTAQQSDQSSLATTDIASWQAITTQFEHLRQTKDPLQQEYQIALLAKERGISEEKVQLLFQKYVQTQNRQRLLKSWKAPLYLLLLPEIGSEWLANSFNQMDGFKVIEYMGKMAALISIVWGLIVFIHEVPKRQQQRQVEAEQKEINQKRSQYEAWQIVSNNRGKTANSGRIIALQDLNNAGASLAGLDVEKAILPSIRLTGADLYKANLRGSWLSYSDFSLAFLELATLEGATLLNASLREAKLGKANLHKADLRLADLRWADLRGADLTGAQLTDAKLTAVLYDNQTKFPSGFQPATQQMVLIGEGVNLEELVLFNNNLEKADLRRANLQNAYFNGVDLSQVNLEGANLQSLRLENVWDLDQANLKSANLSSASLAQVFLQGSDLRNANLSNADLTGANLSDADLRQANLSQIQLERAVYNEKTQFPIGFDPEASGMQLIEPSINLSYARLNDANLSQASFFKADFSKADLSNTIFYQADLSQCQMKGVILKNATLTQAIFADTDMQEAVISSADLSSASLYGSNLSKANLENASLISTDLHRANLRGANLTNADLTGANLNNADLTDAKGLTITQVKKAMNWELAEYSPQFRKKLEAEEESNSEHGIWSWLF